MELPGLISLTQKPNTRQHTYDLNPTFHIQNYYCDKSKLVTVHTMQAYGEVEE
jgi:hypothetical protein